MEGGGRREEGGGRREGGGREEGGGRREEKERSFPCLSCMNNKLRVCS